jgi:hypothetical protein
MANTTFVDRVAEVIYGMIKDDGFTEKGAKWIAETVVNNTLEGI